MPHRLRHSDFHRSMDKVQVGDLWRGRYAKNLLTVCDSDLALVIDIYEMSVNNKTKLTYLTWEHCVNGKRFSWEIYHFMEEFEKIS